MQYAIHELAELSGVTVRTLQYYDNIGLLSPQTRLENGYRVYGEKEVNRLQQILLYRESGFSLKKIKEILENPSYDYETALLSQLDELMAKKMQLEQMIATVLKTVSMLKGKEVLSDEEKFAGFKKAMVQANEKAFGKELRTRFGDAEIDASIEKINNLDALQWNSMVELEELILSLLKEAFFIGETDSAVAVKVCELHKEWLCMQWKEGTYSKEIHLALAEGYVSDSRFTAYYDKIGEGCTKFLRDCIKSYVSRPE